MVTFINSDHLLRTVSVCGVLDKELGVYFFRYAIRLCEFSDERSHEVCQALYST